MSNPFGTAPDDEVFELKEPDAADDPFGSIGGEDPETGEYLCPDKPARAECIGKCVAIKQKKGPAGDMLVLDFVATEGRFAGREWPLYVSFSQKARFKVTETKKTFGIGVDEFFSKNRTVGVYCTLLLQDEEYEGRWNAKLRGTKAHPKGVGFRGGNQLP